MKKQVPVIIPIVTLVYQLDMFFHEKTGPCYNTYSYYSIPDPETVDWGPTGWSEFGQGRGFALASREPDFQPRALSHSCLAWQTITIILLIY